MTLRQAMLKDVENHLRQIEGQMNALAIERAECIEVIERLSIDDPLPKDAYTVKEAVRYLKNAHDVSISVPSLYAYRNDGIGPNEIENTSPISFTKSSLDAWAEQWLGKRNCVVGLTAA